MCARKALLICSLIAAFVPSAVFARSATSIPPLPAPSGTVVNVSTESQLQAAVSHLASNTTIVLAPGTYRLTGTLWISGTYSNVGIRGATNNRDDVVLVGPGMTNANYGNVPFGIWTGGNVQGVTIANLTVRDLYEHPIIFNGGTQSPRVYNVHLIDAGQQFLKSNPDASGIGASNGDVEYSIFEYTTTAPSGYTNAVDIHGGANWTVRHNLFRNIVGPSGQLAGPTILAWDHSSGTLTEGNTFLNCARGIAYGLQDASGNDHSGGIIRNNFFYRSSTQPGDVAIQVADSPNTQVLNNTVLVSGTYPYPIEYRFAGTTGVVIKNNLLDGAVLARDGATGAVQNNVTSATSAIFVNAPAGDLHLNSTATAAIDRGVALADVTDDWDGQARPIGSAPDIGANEFSGSVAAITFAIGGHVRNDSGAAVPGVTVTLSGSSTVTQATDLNGAYNFTNLAGGGNFTVTPSKSGITFTPATRMYSALAANQSAADFSAATTSTAPTVSLTAPASGATLTAPATIAVSASAGSTTSSISNVAFYAGTTRIGTDRRSPYGVSWTVKSAGSYSLTAVATDARGVSTRSAARVVTVTVGAQPPPPVVTVTQTAPASAGSYTAPAEIPLAANATTSSGTVSKVDFFNGATLIATATTAPFAATWSNVPTGAYALSARATTSGGTTATSAPVNVTVGAQQPPPPPVVTVTLTSPASGSSYLAPITLTFAADASTTSGTIARVDFFNGSTLIGSDATAPYAGTWSNVGVGTYAIVAKATTSSGATAMSALATVTVAADSIPPPAGGLVQATSLVPVGTFRLPQSLLGSQWGFGSYAGCCGLGTYGVTFNPARNSIYVGGHPYEQRIAEIAIPAVLTGNPVATALSNLIDPLEGKLGSINPSDPNTKIVSASLVIGPTLYIGAYSYYDGAGTQTKSYFARPSLLSTTGSVVGPARVGSNYQGWVDRVAAPVPADWQAALGAPAFAGGGGGAINSNQSWGPSLSVFNPAQIGSVDPVPATLVLGYPIAHPLADTSVGNAFWSQADTIAGVVAIPGTRSVLFVGYHGMGNYCYGTGAECGDQDNGSKGTHAYPYRSQVWAYDLNDLLAVKAGTVASYSVKPYAVWELDPAFKEIQGAAYDPDTHQLYVSQVGGDKANSGQPLIRVYHVQ